MLKQTTSRIIIKVHIYFQNLLLLDMWIRHLLKAIRISDSILSAIRGILTVFIYDQFFLHISFALMILHPESIARVQCLLV